MLVLTYPHLKPSLEPKRLRREDIWTIAEEARRQLWRGPKPQVEIALIAAQTACLQINGLTFELRWHFDQAIIDAAGRPVIGAVEHDPAWPEGASISIDSTFIGGSEELGRSTAAHELGHAIFDTPAWVRNARSTTVEPAQRYHLTKAPQRDAATEVDWVEWRANEFMGAFLVPRSLLHRHMHKRAVALDIPLIESGRCGELPVVCPCAPPLLIDELIGELAHLFGVSESFVEVRLRRYDLVPFRLQG